LILLTKYTNTNTKILLDGHKNRNSVTLQGKLIIFFCLMTNSKQQQYYNTFEIYHHNVLASRQTHD